SRTSRPASCVLRLASSVRLCTLCVLCALCGSNLVLGPWSLVLGPWSLVLGPWSLVLRPLPHLDADAGQRDVVVGAHGGRRREAGAALFVVEADLERVAARREVAQGDRPAVLDVLAGQPARSRPCAVSGRHVRLR